jgi:hypothetical protein
MNVNESYSQQQEPSLRCNTSEADSDTADTSPPHRPHTTRCRLLLYALLHRHHGTTKGPVSKQCTVCRVPAGVIDQIETLDATTIEEFRQRPQGLRASRVLRASRPPTWPQGVPR